MTDNWQSLGSITARIVKSLEPETYKVTLHHSLATAIEREAERSGCSPEILIAEAVRSYMGDAA